MLFNSAEFLVFFAVVASGYFVLPHRARWVWLLAASYFFYGSWRVEYLGLILISTAVDYGVGLGFDRTRNPGARRGLLALSLAVNLGLLFTFKYFNFFVSSLESVLDAAGMEYLVPHLSVLLPVGISFYTFQTLSYTLDVYRGRIPVERHAGRFALFVAFFPQLVAGPIERARRLLPQLARRHDFEYARARSGLMLMLWGLFKKMVIADRLGVVVDFVYGAPERCPGPLLALGTVFFAFQIYCDFSGYTDIARGCARVLGIELMKNFDRPYVARSIADFWRRWHVSLTSWFRDYVYVPLGGNRSGRRRWIINVIAVFLISGLWHGANWTFIIWGALHATFYFVERLWSTGEGDAQRTRAFSIVQDTLRLACTFFLVCIAWVFFRAESISDAWYVLRSMAHGWLQRSSYADTLSLIPAMDLSTAAFFISGALIVFLVGVETYQGDRDIEDVLAAQPPWLRWSVYIALVMAIWNLGITHETPFVYFQF